MHTFLMAAFMHMNLQRCLVGERIAVAVGARRAFGCAIELVADAHHQFWRALVHLELDGLEVSAPAGAFVQHRGSNGEKRKGLFHTQRIVRLRMDLRHDRTADPIELQLHERGLRGRTTPSLNQCLDVCLVPVR